LLKLVQIDQDVPDYWIALGQLQLQLGQYREGYDSFAHAHELDRTNVEVLSVMTELALLSGQNDLAAEQADALSMLDPNNRVVILQKSDAALRIGDLAKASSGADTLLASAPNDPLARLLKARVLASDGQTDEAIRLLEEQHRAMPSDGFAIKGLIALYRSRGDWLGVARTELDAFRQHPGDTGLGLRTLEALLRAGKIDVAEKLSARFLAPGTDPKIVEAALDSWAAHGPPGGLLPSAEGLANQTSGDQRVAFANYFNRMNKPQMAAALLGGSQVPVTHVNAPLNAALAQSLALQGRTAEAKALFDQVLAREPDQPEALRGRSELEARTGNSRQAIVDAQRLVTLRPKSGSDRLVLARAYLAAKNGREVRRTLWQAFQDLPDDEQVRSALRSVLVSSGDVDGQRRLNDEYADHRRLALTEDMIR
jgi:tetratricopeptide (TPR) repeat protein